ncbi:MAG TPA: PrsW family glutamic-type intramembrane protease, partial [Saprospiraceae bacterium]|nr:PrsW family glutamic-type intramembrane protease [Saprospiraceae bacterium]
SALVGITLGRLKFGRGHSRLLSVLLGWASAMILHLIFNNIVNMQAGITTLVLLVVIGLGSLGVVAAFIFWGLAEERRWLHDTLRANVGVSREESSVVQKMEDLNVLLAPIGERFGPEKRKQVEHLIHLEAQLGLKVKTHSLTPDPKLSETLGTQIAAMEQQASQLQREIGLSCMTLVRILITKDVVSMLSRLQSLEAKETLSQGSIWAIHTTKPS